MTWLSSQPFTYEGLQRRARSSVYMGGACDAAGLTWGECGAHQSWCPRPLTSTAGKVYSGVGAAAGLASLVLPTYSFSLKSRAPGTDAVLAAGAGCTVSQQTSDLAISSPTPYPGCSVCRFGVPAGQPTPPLHSPFFPSFLSPSALLEGSLVKLLHQLVALSFSWLLDFCLTRT